MEGLMRERRTANQIQRLLQEAERDLAKGLTFADVSRKLGISRVTLFRWRAQRRSPQTEDARHVRELEGEIERLKRLVAELMLDKQMLQDVAKKKW
jgi:putative transposase